MVCGFLGSSLAQRKEDDSRNIQDARDDHTRPDQRKIEPDVHVARHSHLIPPVECQQKEWQMEQPLGEWPARVPWVANG